LYIVTGGSENLAQTLPQKDYLYENIGTTKGLPEFVLTEGRLPLLYQSGSCVRPADIDNDGDIDLFIGTRMIPSYYGLPCDQFILVNDGKGYFTDETSKIAAPLKSLGMVTDASWFDYDHDGFLDLMLIGEWMPITIFKNNGKSFTVTQNISGLSKTEGWWNRVIQSDIDQDGDTDFILGNLGLNSKFTPSLDSPVSLYVNDFDQNGSIEPIFSFSKNGKQFPYALRQDIFKQMSSLKKKFIYYSDYADKSIDEIFDKKLLEGSTKLKIYEPRTSILINNGGGGFLLKPLPIQAQFSPVFGITTYDVNNDTFPDIILGGNLFAVKPEIGRYDAMHGLLLIGNKDVDFKALDSFKSGFKVEGEIRHIGVLRSKKRKLIAVIRNNNSIKFYRRNK
jgi:hypothetical protein